MSGTGSASCRCRGPGFRRRGSGFACGCCDCLGSVATGKGIELLLEGLPHPWRDWPPRRIRAQLGRLGRGLPDLYWEQPLPPKWGAILRPTGPGGTRVSRGVSEHARASRGVRLRNMLGTQRALGQHGAFASGWAWSKLKAPSQLPLCDPGSQSRA